MTNQQNFKKGDMVRLKPKDQLPDWLKSSSGQIAEVAAYFPDEDRYSMKFGNEYHTMKGEYFEHCPRDIYLNQLRMAFLTRLQSLLREYDAEIICREGDCELHIDLGNGNTFGRISYPFEYCDYDINDVGRLNLTADNIMEFDKE